MAQSNSNELTWPQMASNGLNVSHMESHTLPIVFCWVHPRTFWQVSFENGAPVVWCGDHSHSCYDYITDHVASGSGGPSHFAPILPGMTPEVTPGSKAATAAKPPKPGACPPKPIKKTRKNQKADPPAPPPAEEPWEFDQQEGDVWEGDHFMEDWVEKDSDSHLAWEQQWEEYEAFPADTEANGDGWDGWVNHVVNQEGQEEEEEEGPEGLDGEALEDEDVDPWLGGHHQPEFTYNPSK